MAPELWGWEKAFGLEEEADEMRSKFDDGTR